MRHGFVLKKRDISDSAPDPLETEIVFDANGKAVKRTYYLLLSLQVFIQELRTLDGFGKEMFR